jgi:hypothetical protein
MTKCRGCGKEILFAYGPYGKIPLEAVKHVYTVQLGVIGMEATPVVPADGSQLYISHQLTCPKADQFAKKPVGPRNDDAGW